MPAAIAATGLLAVYLLKDMDTVHSFHTDRKAAERDDFFSKGWLPAILPESASAIEVESDLDLNTSTGSFQISPADASSFKAHLNQSPDAQSTYFYRQDDTAWTFSTVEGEVHWNYSMRTLVP